MLTTSSSTFQIADNIIEKDHWMEKDYSSKGNAPNICKSIRTGTTNHKSNTEKNAAQKKTLNKMHSSKMTTLIHSFEISNGCDGVNTSSQSRFKQGKSTSTEQNKLLLSGKEQSVELTKSGMTKSNSATIPANINPHNKQKSTNSSREVPVPVAKHSTTDTQASFTQQQDSQLISNKVSNINNTMPLTSIVTNHTNRKKNDSPSPSTSSSTSSNTSSTSYGQQDLLDSPPPCKNLSKLSITSNNNNTSNSTPSTKNTVRQAIKEYYKIEGLLEKNDEGLQLLRAYLAERRNDEMLIYLESNREFKLMRRNYKNDVNMSRKCLLKEFKTIYDNFVNFESLTCMNIASSIREPFTQTLKEVVLLSQDEIPCQALCEKMEKCLDTLLFNIQLQFNNEIMTHFKKSSEFRTFVITKLIELSASETSSIMDEIEKTSPRTPGEYQISNILVDNEMEEYSKTFAKKKLVTLDQIRYFTADDYRDKIGMKKIGHLKRIVRVVNEHFNKPPLNL